MKLTAVILITAVLLSLACKADYDIKEVAPPEHLGLEHHHEHDETDHEHEAETVELGSVHDESHEHDVSEISGSNRHVHDAGERSHCTGWFFNQPWAASFIWGKMVRDAVILLVLSAVILFVSGYRRKHQ
ncbi:MAG: hypothetical protein KAT09_00650 [Candidatus Aegiribacteria sp.]|nr:hypothetical protein [Candidatus Aegiribacteria sp.]